MELSLPSPFISYPNLKASVEQTARMDVAGLDGRPRDMWSCKLSMTGKGDDTLLNTSSLFQCQLCNIMNVYEQT